MFDPTKPYCRRDGKSAKIVYTFKDGDYLVVYDWRDGVKELVYRINKDGYYRDSGHCGYGEHEADLINIPEKIEGWLIFYKDGSVSNRLTEKEKDDHLSCEFDCFLACIKVSFTEGEGLSDD